MGTRNDDISLKLAKAVKSGFLPDVKDWEVDILTKEAKAIFGNDTGLRANVVEKINAQSALSRRLDVSRAYPKFDASLAPTQVLTGPSGSAPRAIHIAYNSPLFTMPGAVRGYRQFTARDHSVNKANGEGTRPPFWVEFDITGSGVTLDLTPETSAGFTIWLWINDTPTTEAPVAITAANTTASRYFYDLAFASAGTYRVKAFISNGAIAGLDIDATSIVQAPSITRPQVLMYGDSFVEGAQSVLNWDLFAFKTGMYLGADMYRAGQGGSGHIQDATVPAGEPYLGTTRLDAIAQMNLDAIYIYGSSNDDNAVVANPGSVKAAAASLYATLDTLKPGVPIIVIGPYSAGTTANATRLTVRNELQAAANAAPNVIGFIDPIAEIWLPDAQWAVLKAADNVHLNTLGHGYWAVKLANRLTEVYRAWLAS